MADKTCATCGNWEPADDDTRPGYGTCRAVPFFLATDRVEDRPEALVDGDDGAALMTLPTFGCVLHLHRHPLQSAIRGRP